MSVVAAIGAQTQVAGFALAGVLVCPADRGEEVEAAWQALPGAVTVVILTDAAARALDADSILQTGRLTVVMPP